MMHTMQQRMQPSARVPQSAARTQKHRQQLRRPVMAPVCAAQKPAIAQFADSIGLPTDEGLFGFKPFSEVWTGRLAMMGFLTSILVEAQTGMGTLQQLGLGTPSNNLFTVLAGATLVGTAAAAGVTAYRGFAGKMTDPEAQRYKEFLMLHNEEELIASSRKQGSAADSFLSGNSQQAIADARKAGTPADAVLNADSSADVDAVRAEGMPADSVLGNASPSVQQPAASTSRPAAAPRSYDDTVFSNLELKYARDVELRNGRAAMLGFLAAVLVEAATGKGILMQLIMWGKISGLLGYASGF